MANISKFYLRDATWLTIRGLDVEPSGVTLPGTASLGPTASLTAILTHTE